MFIEEMEWRGLIKQVSHDQLRTLMGSEKIALYSGFDPSAASFHVGNLMPILALRRAQLDGHKAVALLGGATGMIGDPSGKSAERNLLSVEVLEANTAGLRKQLEGLLDFSNATMVNNIDWFRPMSFLDFLRDTGKHFSVNAMIAKDSVRTRLEEREQGISYTEFSYMLIQAYDFCHLYETEKCRLQIGGSEQWGNITAGIDLIRRLHGAEAYGLTLPLLLDSSGKKFGKSEKGAVYLDPNLTSPYDFYQFFVRADDRDVIQLLRFLTLLPRDTIEALEAEHAKAPEKRVAAKELARAMTTLVHGPEETTKAENAAAALFKKAAPGEVPPGTPVHEMDKAAIAQGLLLVDALVTSGLAKSKAAARRAISGGGVYVNGDRIEAADHQLDLEAVQDGLIRLRHGKKNHMVLKVS